MKYKRYFLLASVLLLASALFFACKHDAGGGPDNGGNNNETKKEQFAVTVAEESKTYVKFQDGYEAGTKKDKGTKITFKVELPIDKELVKVTAGTETLTAISGVYTVTVDADTEVKVEVGEAKQFALTVPEWNKNRFEFLDGYVPGTLKYKGEKIRFKAIVPSNKTLAAVRSGADILEADSNGIYTITLDSNREVTVRLDGEFGVVVGPPKYKNTVRFLDDYVEKQLKDSGTTIRFTIEPPAGMKLKNVRTTTGMLTPVGNVYTVTLMSNNIRLTVSFEPITP